MAEWLWRKSGRRGKRRQFRSFPDCRRQPGLAADDRRSSSGSQPEIVFWRYAGAKPNNQQYGIREYGSGNVENKTTTTVGGFYGLVVNRPDSSRAWYGQWSLLHGGVNFHNVVPGEIAGAGLTQKYNGTVTMLTLVHRVSFRQTKGWLLEPQLQLSYIHVHQGDFRDNLGALVSLQRGNSPGGAIGPGSEANLGKDALTINLAIGREPVTAGSFWAGTK